MSQARWLEMVQVHQEKVGLVFHSFTKKFWSLELCKDTKDQKDVFFQRRHTSLMVSVPFLRKDSCIFGVFGKKHAIFGRSRMSLEGAGHLWKDSAVFGRLNYVFSKLRSDLGVHLS